MTTTLVNKVGPWVTGREFWNRETESARLIQLLGQGENIIIAAPRRIGKTSLIRESLNRINGSGEMIGIMVDIQDCSKPEEAIVAISMALKPYQSIWRNILGVFKNFLGTLINKVEEIGNDVITLKIREGVAGDWQLKGNEILEIIAKADDPVVLALDELPVMVNRMLRKESGQITENSRTQTEVFLSWLRKAMLHHQERIRWIVCGSIGLGPILSQARLNHTIGHLRSLPLYPWEDKVADECLCALAAEVNLSLPKSSRQKMIELLGCNIPHHVQMFFSYVHEHCLHHSIENPTPEDIKKVYERSMLSTRGHAELADLEERLHRVLGGQLIILALDLLTEAAVVGELSGEAADFLANWNAPHIQPTEPKEALRTVLGVLEHDGYLEREAGKGGYKFVSKLVRDWWHRRFQFGYLPAKSRAEVK